MQTHRKIYLISLILSSAFFVAMIATPIATLLAWLQYPMPLLSQFGPNVQYTIAPPVEILAPIPRLNFFAAVFSSLIPMTLTMLFLWFLVKFFLSYKNGNVFTIQSVLYLKRSAQFLFASELFDPIYQAISSALLTMNNPAGHRVIMIGLSNNDISNIFIAATLLAISWILAEATALKDEQQFII